MRADWTRRIYVVVATVLLAGYFVAEARGVVLASAEQKMPLPPDVKSSRGGYRTHTFWNVGYMGGK